MNDIDTNIIHIDNHKHDYKFITESSKNISDILLHYAEENILRAEYVININNILLDIDIAIELELGIFEFSLNMISTNQLANKFIVPIYIDKYNEIMLNIDENTHLKNKTFKNLILSKKYQPQLIPFLSPEQIHPIKWADIFKKREYRLYKEQNMATADTHVCQKCGEKKCKITQSQTRSADEPVTTFITCMVCFSTFTE